jgi:hypothetical protein
MLRITARSIAQTGGLLLMTVHAASCANSNRTIPANQKQPSSSVPRDSPLPPRSSVSQSTVIWIGKPWPCEIFWGDTSDRAAVAVYVFGRGGLEGKGAMPWLIAAVWSDGRVVASADQLEGGRPYSQGRIDPEAANSLIRTLTGIASESDMASTIKPAPPDYAKTFIQFRTSDGHVYELGSCHELEGDSELNHELKMEVEANFRRTWANIRRAIMNAIPKKMEPAAEGVVRFEIVKREGLAE